MYLWKVSVSTLVLIALSASVIDGGHLPSVWCTDIKRLCDDFDDKNPTPPTTINFNVLQHGTVHCPLQFLAPPCILWSPIEQFSGVIEKKIVCPKCSESGVTNSSLHTVGWRDGTRGQRSEPRKIYGAEGVTLLVGRVYSCSSGHEVVGYHPELLMQIPTCFVHFKLWHITGFTKELTGLIVALVTAGVSIHGIRDVLYQRQLSTYYSLRVKFQALKKSVVSAQELQGEIPEFPSFTEWSSNFSSHLPSQHAISGCYLADFWTKESAYTRHMQDTTIMNEEAWLSCDHTFSSAS